jgi:hypothetical protein
MTGYPWEIQPKGIAKEPLNILGTVFMFLVSAGGIWFFVQLAAPNDVALIAGGVLGGLTVLLITAFGRSAKYQHLQDSSFAEARQATQSATRLLTALVDAVDGAQESANAAGGLITRAKKNLDETAFSPFWDCIERAGGNLAAARTLMVNASSDLLHYQGLLAGREHSFPAAPIFMSDFPDLQDGVATFESLVHQAQRDYHFAAIWEQRRTRQSIVEGFQTLGDLVVELTDAVTSAVDGLRQSIESGNARLTSALTAGFSSTQAQLSDIRESSAVTAKTAGEISRIIEIRGLLRP